MTSYPYPSSQWLQIESPRLQFESMWLVAQKFGFLNCLGMHSLRSALAAGPRPDVDSYAAGSSGALFRQIQRQRQAGQRPPFSADALKTRGPIEMFGSNSGWICDLSKVRFCALCMDHWFHSTLFQITAIQECPWHQAPLTDTCHHCGKSLLGFELPRRQRDLLRCPYCRQPYSSEEMSLPGLFAVSDALSPIVNQFSQLQEKIEAVCRNWQLECRDQYDLLPYADNQRVIRTRSMEMLWTIAMPGEPLPKCCAPSSGVFTSLILDRNIAPWEEGDDANHVLAGLKELGAQVKSIGRHFQRKILRICGHSVPLRPDFGCDANEREYRYFLLFDDLGCQCCAALALWRAKFALLFAVIRRLQDRIAHDRSIDLGQLSNWLVASQISAPKAYSLFSETVLSFSTCRGLAAEVSHQLKCMYQETIGQAYRTRGMPWVEEGAVAWRAKSSAREGFIFLNERLVEELLCQLNDKKLVADICLSRWSAIEPGVWHFDLAEVQQMRRWHEIGLA